MIGLRIFVISTRSAILSILFILSRTQYSTDAWSRAGIAAVPKRCSRSLSYSDLVPSAGFEPALDGV
jgi:hypothetical protein